MRRRDWLWFILTKAANNLRGICARHAIDHGEHVSETAGRELNAFEMAKFGMARESRMRDTVRHQLLWCHVSSQDIHKVLCGCAMSCFIKEDRDEVVGPGAKVSIEEAHLRARVVRATCVATKARCASTGSKENNRVPAELHIGLEVGDLLDGQRLASEGVYGHFAVLGQVDGKWKLRRRCRTGHAVGVGRSC